MLYGCFFKNQLFNIYKSFGKFNSRDLEIRRACHSCNIDLDKEKCILFRICGQKNNDLEEKIESHKLSEEIKNKKKYIELLKEDIESLKDQKEQKEITIIKLNNEIVSLKEKAIKIRANDFLRSTIGDENYIFFKSNGYIDIMGTNRSTYRIGNGGSISKLERENDKRLINRIIDVMFSNSYVKRRREPWVGKIKSSNYPLEDAIAIVYINILKDSDKFDRDKGCGTIFINTIS